MTGRHFLAERNRSSGGLPNNLRGDERAELSRGNSRESHCLERREMVREDFVLETMAAVWH